MRYHLLNADNLLYWMDEREKVRKKKELGEPKPWSGDQVFQTVYFCNVNREHDRVTKFIRKMYSHRVHHSLFVHNIILSRFLNWPPTLDELNYIDVWDPPYVKDVLNSVKRSGQKVWGNAYVVTTHGIPMDKIDYLCDRVMPSIAEAVIPKEPIPCEEMSFWLMKVEGISTFMAGQVIADLKNTPGHYLKDAPDWDTFALPGPGSRRGMDWVCGEHVPDSEWHPALQRLNEYVRLMGWRICNQDLQNCLCEFDKYMRVSTGSGRSKRKYDGV